MTKTIFAAASAAMVLLASASAQDLTIRINSADLETRAGTERVYDMMQRRVSSVCNDGSVATRSSQDARIACRDDMLDQLVSSLNRPELYALHNDETQFAGQ